MAPSCSRNSAPREKREVWRQTRGQVKCAMGLCLCLCVRRERSDTRALPFYAALGKSGGQASLGCKQITLHQSLNSSRFFCVAPIFRFLKLGILLCCLCFRLHDRYQLASFLDTLPSDMDTKTQQPGKTAVISYSSLQQAKPG